MVKIQITLENPTQDEFNRFVTFYTGRIDEPTKVVDEPTKVVDEIETPDPSAPTVDTDGAPWDARIHSGSKAINADGRWKKRKGVDSGVIATVEAELKAMIPISHTQNLMTYEHPTAKTYVNDKPVNAAPTGDTFFVFVDRVTRAKSNGTLTEAHYNAVIAANGLTTLFDARTIEGMQQKLEVELWPV